MTNLKDIDLFIDEESILLSLLKRNFTLTFSPRIKLWKEPSRLTYSVWFIKWLYGESQELHLAIIVGKRKTENRQGSSFEDYVVVDYRNNLMNSVIFKTRSRIFSRKGRYSVPFIWLRLTAEKIFGGEKVDMQLWNLLHFMLQHFSDC